MDLRSEVGKCVPQPAVKFEHASLIRLTAWLRRMIMEIIGEQFVEQLPITPALHFDRVAADNRLGGLADTVRHHYLHLRLEFDTADRMISSSQDLTNLECQTEGAARHDSRPPKRSGGQGGD